MKRLIFPVPFLTAAVLLIVALVLIGCGGGEETTLTTAPPTTAAPTATTATTTPESTTTVEQTIDEELVGIWANEQGIELEFTSDGVFTLRYQGQEAESLYSTKNGKASYISFEPNAQGERLPTETEYRMAGDTLVWDSGENELAFTRKQ